MSVTGVDTSPWPTRGKIEPVQRTSAWKDVTLKVHGGNDELVLPVMTATRVGHVMDMLKEKLNLDNAQRVEFLIKQGGHWRRQRRQDEVGKIVFVKGIPSFERQRQKYVHPIAVIGAGMQGIRQAIELILMGHDDFALFERKGALGGAAWRDHANTESKLQSEGPVYQVQWHKDLPMVTDYGLWPSRATILQHMCSIADQYGVSRHVRFNADVTSMNIDAPLDSVRSYTLSVHDERGSAEDSSHVEQFTCSGMLHYPGALRDMIHKEFPGEDEFGGQVEYGLGNRMDYRSVHKAKVVIVGMGAFAVENSRSCFEFGAEHTYVVARNQNLLLPRLLSWWMNCSPSPVPAAMVLDAMEPMYNIAGWDAWSNNAVRAPLDRRTAHIKQNARWGIGDFFFLAVFYGQVELIIGEVKRLSHRTVHLLEGHTLADIDHFIKVVGFTADYTVDQLHQVQEFAGFWPEGDWQRFVFSEMGAMDAARFGGTSISPGANSTCYMATHFLFCPRDARALVESSALPKNKARIDARGILLPAYVWDPRMGAMASLTMGFGCAAILEHEAETEHLKRNKMFELADPQRFIDECAKDWNRYCEMFSDRGDFRAAPPYPYTVEFALRILKQNDDFGKAEEDERSKALGYDLQPNTARSMAPAEKVVVQRSHSSSPSPSRGERDAWLEHAREVEARLRACSPVH